METIQAAEGRRARVTEGESMVSGGEWHLKQRWLGEHPRELKANFTRLVSPRLGDHAQKAGCSEWAQKA